MSLNKYLKSLNKEQLIEQIGELYQKYKDVKTYYQYFMNPDDKTIADNYKKIIRNQFFPSRGFGDPKLSVARKAVNDFKKLSPPAADIADMMLYYVENGVEFTKAYGDIDEPFYNSMESMFSTACKFIKINELIKVYTVRCEKILTNSIDTGWGLHDGLYDIYYEFMK